MAKKQLFGKAPLTIVRTNSGSAIYVYKGHAAPGDVSAEEKKRLIEEGYLEERDVADEAAADDTGADAFDVNKGGNVKDTLAWVGDDKSRAKEALKVEQDKPTDQQRSSLVTALEALAEPEN